jgi:hypothetical protein
MEIEKGWRRKMQQKWNYKVASELGHEWLVVPGGPGSV